MARATQQSLNRIDIPQTWPDPTNYDESQPRPDPKQCNTWKTITNPEDIDFYIRMRNRGHFGQAHGMPFTTTPLSDNINWEATTLSAQEISEGHSQIDTISLSPNVEHSWMRAKPPQNSILYRLISRQKISKKNSKNGENQPQHLHQVVTSDGTNLF